MNILIPHQWLLEHLETKAEPTELQKQLSLCGPSVERIYEREGDSVYDIEVTTNRVDAMSVRGIAREAAVILQNAGWPSRLKPLNLPDVIPGDKKLPLPKIMNLDSLCERIVCVVLDGVKHGDSPEWLQTRLRQVDLNPKDVAIDITNAVSHELGHPCHAFDYDKIMALGGEIHVVAAEPGMIFTTLDEAQYTTQGGEVVFVNNQGVIIDLPGIMGTLNTAVDTTTKRILFWVESIAAKSIRTTSMRHNIRTPAAQLNERDLDHELGREVIKRGVQLYQELCEAQVASPLYDEVITPTVSRGIELPKTEIERYLGLTLPGTQVEDILRQLDCTVTVNDSGWLVVPPSFRTDLVIPADLVEEVARIYGYHNLPSRTPLGAPPTTFPTDTNFALEERVATTLAALGYQEQITYSLVSREDETSQAIGLKNALTSDKEVLRTHILPSHIQVMAKQWNTSLLRGTFELANVYLAQPNELPDEHLVLAITDRDLRALRSTLEILWNRCFIPANSLVFCKKNHKQHEYMASIFKESVFITLNDRVLGIIGLLPDGRAGVELEWRELLAVSQRWPSYQPLPKTSPLYQDWRVSVPDKTLVEPIRQALLQSDQRVVSVVMIDQYEQYVTFRVEMLDRENQMDAPRAEEIKGQAKTAVEKLGSQIE